MLIQLTQQEIKDAIHAYVVSEDGLGINLKGKTLTTNFTATRGEQGIIANLSIDKVGAAGDVDIPGYTNPVEAEVIPATPAAEPVAADAPSEAKAKPVKAAAADKGTPAPVTTATLEAAAPAAAPAEAAPAPVAEAAPAAAEEVAEAKVATTTTSLFG